MPILDSVVARHAAEAGTFTQYHDEHARFGGASQEFHARALTWIIGAAELLRSSQARIEVLEQLLAEKVGQPPTVPHDGWVERVGLPMLQKIAREAQWLTRCLGVEPRQERTKQFVNWAARDLRLALAELVAVAQPTVPLARCAHCGARPAIDSPMMVLRGRLCAECIAEWNREWRAQAAPSGRTECPTCGFPDCTLPGHQP